jgi:Rap1a immunity proteins
MKRSIPGIVVFLASVGIGTLSAASAEAQTARELLPICESLQRRLHIEGTQVFIPPGSDVAQCWGFMSAVQQYTKLADQSGNRLLDACPGPDTTTAQILGKFIEYARSHPDKLGLPAAVIAVDAMRDAFSCGAHRT